MIRLRQRLLFEWIAFGHAMPTFPLDRHTRWYGLRAHDRARPLSDLGCRTLGVHLVVTTEFQPPIEDVR